MSKASEYKHKQMSAIRKAYLEHLKQQAEDSKNDQDA